MRALQVIRGGPREYPLLRSAYFAALAWWARVDPRPPAWWVFRDSQGRYVCWNRHIQTTVDTVTEVGPDNQLRTRRACLRCFADSIPNVVTPSPRRIANGFVK